MRILTASALVTALTCSPVLAGTIESQWLCDHAAVVVAGQSTAVRVTASDPQESMIEIGYKEGRPYLKTRPVGVGRPGDVRIEPDPDGKHRATYRVAWPGVCPCRVEALVDDEVTTWEAVRPPECGE